MIGKGILLECLQDTRIDKVLAINRRTLNITHPKLQEVLHKDFSDITPIRKYFVGCDACFYSMGVSALGKTVEEYNHLTFEIVKHWADTLYLINPLMVFNYVSGQGTDSSEKGRSMWARVKGKSENYIINKGFKSSTMFRPGLIIPEKGIKSQTSWYSHIYTLLTPLFPLLKKMESVTTTTKIGQAMINSLTKGKGLGPLENKGINQLSQ